MYVTTANKQCGLYPVSMANDALIKRLSDHEDNFVERKPANPNRDDIRKTVVAFANSVPEGRDAVLFIGVRKDGQLDPVPNTDKLQKTIREVCEQDCYPPITYTSEVLNLQNGPVVAVIVAASTLKPHFAGPAYVRRGSESVIASEQVFNELVYSRNSKTAALLKLKGQIVTVVALQHRLGDTKQIGDSGYRETAECRVEACDPHIVTLYILTSSRTVSEPLDHVTLQYDHRRYRSMLIVKGY